MRVVGIDLATTDDATAVAEMVVTPDAVAVERTVTGVTDAYVRRLLDDSSIAIVGINAPVTVAGAKPAVDPDVAVVAMHLSARYRVRATDRWRRAHLVDLPLPTDEAATRRAMAGIRADRLLAGQEPKALDPTLTIREVVEVCPAISMYRWGLPYAGYVAHEGRAEIAEVREMVVAELSSRLQVAGLSLQARDGAQLNAILAGLSAVAAKFGLTERVPDEAQVHARVEGWIQVPLEGSLARLLEGLNVAA